MWLIPGPLSSHYRPIGWPVLDFSITGPEGNSDYADLQGDLLTDGQPNTAAGKLGKSQARNMSGWGKLPLSLIHKTPRQPRAISYHNTTHASQSLTFLFHMENNRNTLNG